MKTTIEISNPLFEKSRRYAARKGTTFREVVETALSLFLREGEKEKKLKLKDCSVGGEGLVDELKGLDWAEIRRRSYGGRAG